MADISKLQLGATTYNIKDETARQSIETATEEAGASISMSVNPTTYVVTVQLLNSSGTVLSTATIDLPLESVVVSGEYDDATKEVVLTLQNGSTVRFSVADLVDGLASETGTYPGMTVGTAQKVSNALTLQVNGAGTVTFDGSAARTFNVSVPVKLSELTNDAGYVKASYNAETETLVLSTT